MIVVRTLVVLAAFGATTALAAGPKVQIVIGAKAEPIERFAADEMAGQLKKLFDAEVTIGQSAPADAANVILLGNPATHEVMRNLNLALPKLSDQGHALKTVKIGDRTMLVVAGGSPRAVMWAAYELGWSFGVRYFPFGDLYPVTSPMFALESFDVVLEPRGNRRIWFPLFASKIGPESWGRDEHFRMLRQLAKLKYTDVKVWAPQLKDAELVQNHVISVDGDTVGRSAFKGAKVFDNPEFAMAGTITARRKIVEELASEIATEADRLGFATDECFLNLNDSVLPLPIPARIRSLLPTMGHSYWADIVKRHFGDADQAPSATTADVNVSDAALSLVYLGRATWYSQKTPAQVCDDLLDPVCGKGVSERTMMAFDSCEKACLLVVGNDYAFSLPDKSLFIKHFASTEPPPAWWGEVRTHYLNAMNEMYRANTRAREGGRAFTLYYARRFEFGFEYMNAVEALRKAAIAKAAGDKDTQITELEKALDSITNACNAMAAVARSQSDRGIIAAMNEYGYRPVMKLLEEADSEK